MERPTHPTHPPTHHGHTTLAHPASTPKFQWPRAGVSPILYLGVGDRPSCLDPPTRNLSHATCHTGTPTAPDPRCLLIQRPVATQALVGHTSITCLLHTSITCLLHTTRYSLLCTAYFFLIHICYSLAPAHTLCSQCNASMQPSAWTVRLTGEHPWLA